MFGEFRQALPLQAVYVCVCVYVCVYVCTVTIRAHVSTLSWVQHRQLSKFNLSSLARIAGRLSQHRATPILNT